MRTQAIGWAAGGALLLLAALGGPAQTAVGEPQTPVPLFEDATEQAGLKGIKGIRAAFADLDKDGRPDAIVDNTRVFLNRGGTFVPSPIGDHPRIGGIQVADVNNDGIPDLFLARSTDLLKEGFKDDGLRNELWLGDGKGGYLLKADSGLGAHAESTISACFVDTDNDGILDLFVGNAYVSYGHGLEASPNRLYHGKGDGTFEEVTEKAGLLGVPQPGRPDSRRPTYGVAHTDWNNDGLQDLLVMTYGRQANRLWKNNGDGTFTDAAVETTFDGDDNRDGKYPKRKARETEGRADEPPWRANGNTFDCAVADYDGDGNMDCFLAEITHWWAGPSSDFSSLLVNQGKEKGYRFQRKPELIQRTHDGEDWNQGDLHAGWLDVDNDGLLDLLIASTDYPDLQMLRLYHQKPDHTFEEWTDRLGFKWVHASQISLADVDRDGATDILVSTNNHRMTAEQKAKHDLGVGLFRNLCPKALGNRFLSLRLTGGGAGKANRDAIGARVTLWIGGKRQVREVYGGLGHACHRDDTELRFGAGKAEKVDKIEVRWPDKSGTVQVFENVETNRFYRLDQGGNLEKAK